MRRTRPLDGLFNAQRGNAVRIGPGSNGSSTVAILTTTADCQDPESIAVSLGVTVEDQVTANEGPRDTTTLAFVRARIEWDTGNANLSVDMDFASGATITVVAEAVRVFANYIVEIPPWETDCDPCCLPTYRVTAALGYGGACRIARLTEVAFVTQPGKRCRVPVPDFAGMFTVLPIRDSKVTAHIMPCGRGNEVRDVIVTPLSNLGQSNRIDQIPLFNGARWVEIENRNTDGSPASAYVVFGLAL